MSESALATTTHVTLEPITCYLCGVAFGVPAHLKEKRLNDHRSFFCPNGHEQHYTGPTEADKLRKQLETANYSRAFYERRLGEEVRSKRAVRAHLTKAKKKLDRVAHGVCPCCNRSFQNLRRHMSAKHPGFSDDGT